MEGRKVEQQRHKLVDEPSWILGDAENRSVQEDKEGGWGTELPSRHQINIYTQG